LRANKRHCPQGADSGDATDNGSTHTPITLCISNQPSGPILWTVRDLSPARAPAFCPYMGRLLAGYYRESSSADGRVHVLWEIDDEAPLHVVGAFVRLLLFDPSSADGDTLLLAACMVAYVDPVQFAAFLAPGVSIDIYGLGRILNRPITDGPPPPVLVVMVYVLFQTGIGPGALGMIDVFATLARDCDVVPQHNWMAWTTYGTALARTMDHFHADVVSTDKPGTDPATRALDHLLSKLQGDTDVVRVALDEAIIAAVLDWRRTLAFSHHHGAVVESAPRSETTSHAHVPLSSLVAGSLQQRTIVTVCPFDSRTLHDSSALPEYVLPALVGTRAAFLQQLSQDFSLMGAALAADTSPFFADGGLVVAGSGVVRALQNVHLRAHSDKSVWWHWSVQYQDPWLDIHTLKLWAIGPDDASRRAAFDRAVRLVFASVPHDRGGQCHATVVDRSMISFCITATDQASGAVPECVQVIMTDAATPDALVASFDMSHTCAWYDGNTVGITWDCLRAVVSRTTRPRRGIRPLDHRRLKATLDGFVPSWEWAFPNDGDTGHYIIERSVREYISQTVGDRGSSYNILDINDLQKEGIVVASFGDAASACAAFSYTPLVPLVSSRLARACSHAPRFMWRSGNRYGVMRGVRVCCPVIVYVTRAVVARPPQQINKFTGNGSWMTITIPDCDVSSKDAPFGAYRESLLGCIGHQSGPQPLCGDVLPARAPNSNGALIATIAEFDALMIDMLGDVQRLAEETGTKARYLTKDWMTGGTITWRPTLDGGPLPPARSNDACDRESSQTGDNACQGETRQITVRTDGQSMFFHGLTGEPLSPYNIGVGTRVEGYLAITGMRVKEDDEAYATIRAKALWLY